MIVASPVQPQSLFRAVAAFVLCLAALAMPAASRAIPISQIATFPANNAERVAPEAELYFVFDQPTAKAGGFTVADLDSGAGGVVLSLLAPRWSALGDTVFLKPVEPMTYGHQHGMRVNTIVAPDSQNSSVDLQIIYFRVAPHANVQLVGTTGLYESISLVPDRPTPVTIGVRETAGTAATFTRARYRFYAGDEFDLNSPFAVVPTAYTTLPFHAVVPRMGSASLTVPVTITRALAAASGGRLGMELVFDGYDETGLPYTFAASSRVRTNTFPGDSTLILTRAQVTPAIGASIAIGSVFLTHPLPGTVIAAGDTLRPHAVVTGIGTGSYRGAFYVDGEFVAMVEGFLDAGRPDTVSLPGPLPTRRLGERRLQFVVESPQNVASSPVTYLCVAPGDAEARAAAAAAFEKRATEAAGGVTLGLSLDPGTLTQASTKFQGAEGSVTHWSRSTAFAQFGKGGARLEANALWRVRLDDTRNGSASPEQMSMRLVTKRATAEWGDITPSIAAGAPLFASPVPRRAAQATFHAGGASGGATPSGGPGRGLGTFETYVALNAHPRSAGGPAREARSDLYAARWSRAMGSRLQLSAYGGYTHEDPTPGGVDTTTRAKAVYGGSGSLALRGGWRWMGDLATVRHKTIAGVEEGRSRTAARTELAGRIVGTDVRMEGFRYQPDLATELNPYALSDRRGGAVSVGRTFRDMLRVFADYRFEEPESRIGPVTGTGSGLGSGSGVSFGGVPYVSVERLALGTRLSLGPSAAVSPVLIRIRHRGAQTELTEKRFASELTLAEPMGGRTTARVDVALFDDDQGVAKKRKLMAGSIATTRRHPGGITSSLLVGIENDDHADLGLEDKTLQGTLEIRVDAVRERLLVIPYIVYLSRKQETRGVEESVTSGRLQVMLQRIPALRNAAVALEGRIGRIDRKQPIDISDTDYGATLTISQAIPRLP